MAIKRFNGIEEDADGVYVLYEDYQAELSAVREALKKYGRHDGQCKFAFMPGCCEEHDKQVSCSCGLEKAMGGKA